MKVVQRIPYTSIRVTCRTCSSLLEVTSDDVLVEGANMPIPAVVCPVCTEKPGFAKRRVYLDDEDAVKLGIDLQKQWVKENVL